MKKTHFLTACLLLCTSICQASIFDYSETKKYAVGFSLGVTGGGISVFNRERHTVFSANYIKYNDDIYGEHIYEGRETLLHVRRFFKDISNGWYYGAFIHRTILNGKIENEHKKAIQKKTGVGVELGYTSFGLFKSKRLYWGSGAGVSHYLGAKETDIFENNALKNDSDFGYYIDFIRLGIIF